MTWDQCDPDGPPAWWVARCRRADARRPLCDEYGTPMDDEADETSDEADSDGSDDDEPAPEGDSDDGSAP